MGKMKSGRVPVIEDAFEINVAKLLAVSKRTGQTLLRVDDGSLVAEVLLTPTRLAVRVDGQVLAVDIVPVGCLGGRSRPLLKCPRAHEGNFQSLYHWSGSLACRHCHGLRYRSNLAASAVGRARIARSKLLASMGRALEEALPDRQPRKWRKRHLIQSERLVALSSLHYDSLRDWLDRQRH